MSISIERPPAVMSAPQLLSNLELVSFFSSLTHDQLSDAGQLAHLFQTRLGCRLNRRLLRLPDSFPTTSVGLQAKQYPDEIGGFLAFIYQHRQHIRRYLEIGVERGGTYFIVDSFLRAHAPQFKGSVGIDLCRRILRNGFPAYREKYRSCRFVKTPSDQYQFGKADLILIDGDHAYEAVYSDFRRALAAGRFIAFHDIRCPLTPGIGCLWDKVKRDYWHAEFVTRDPALTVPLGIGVIDTQRPR